jgi:DGQHR domain-containing protein
MAKKKKIAAVEFVTVPAHEIKQQGHTMYSFVATSTDLLRICTVSRREEDSEKGYQRHLKESRLRQVARYIDDDKGVIPNNIIINFFGDAVTYTHGRLRFPKNRVSAWVIDGQHRLFGFKYAKHPYSLLVMAFLDLDLREQVDIFTVINTEQRKLPTSLALDLLKFTGDPEKDLDTRCRELVARLNDESDSPWYQGINMTGEGTGIISLVNFVRKLRPHLDLNGVLSNYTFEEQYGAMANYWRAIRAVFVDQWAARGSLLTKTVGFGAIMNVFQTVFTKTLTLHGGEFKVSDLIEVFKLIKDFQFDSETLGAGAGNKAEMAGAKVIVEELTAAIASTQTASKTAILKL